MTSFKEFMEAQSKEPVKGIEVGGDMQCQICYVFVEEAEWFPPQKLLRWTCPQGHVSYIEEFVM